MNSNNISKGVKLSKMYVTTNAFIQVLGGIIFIALFIYLFNQYRAYMEAQRRKILDKITAQRSEARKILLEKLNPILDGYIKKNNISLLINKNTVVATTDNNLDITNIIIEKLNKEFSSLNLK